MASGIGYSLLLGLSGVSIAAPAGTVPGTPLWPAELPNDVLVEGYDEQLADNVIRTQMDAGPPRRRRRYTKGIDRINCTLPALSRDQAMILRAWFCTGLADGTLEFIWVHPVTREPGRFAFVKPPSIRPIGSGAKWRASLELEVQP